MSIGPTDSVKCLYIPGFPLDSAKMGMAGAETGARILLEDDNKGLGLEPDEDVIVRGIGRVLKSLRKNSRLSLNDLARLSGVSRSMLSQMETGKSIPTVLVLCKIARTFDVPVTLFLKSETEEHPTFLTVEETPLRISAGGHCAWRSLTPEGKEGRTGFYEITLRGGGIENMPPYTEGVRANLTVAKGSLCVGLGGRRHCVNAGDVIEFAGDAPHSYINSGKTEAVAYLVLRHLLEQK